MTFPEIPAYNIDKGFWSYIYAGDSNEETFLNSKIEKDTRNQSDFSSWFELSKLRITSSICHRSFIRQRNFGILCTELVTLKTYQSPKLKKH